MYRKVQIFTEIHRNSQKSAEKNSNMQKCYRKIHFLLPPGKQCVLNNQRHEPFFKVLSIRIYLLYITRFLSRRYREACIRTRGRARKASPRLRNKRRVLRSRGTTFHPLSLSLSSLPTRAWGLVSVFRGGHKLFYSLCASFGMPRSEFYADIWPLPLPPTRLASRGPRNRMI